jgi:hypothetical protein
VQESEVKQTSETINAGDINSMSGDGQDTLSAMGEQFQSPSRPSRRVQKLTRQQQKLYKKQIAQYQKAVQGKQRQLKRELEILSQRIGKEDFKLLKSICTVQVPEEKNEAGEVTKKAHSYVNYTALITEAKHLNVLKREEHIVAGKRKRSSGNARNRKMHRSFLSFIQQRNAIAENEPITQSVTSSQATESAT